MNEYSKVIDLKSFQPEKILNEKELRIQLAAAYRIFNYFKWDYLIYGHLTVRVPGPEKHFLINPFGLRYDEVTASNLVKIDIDGNELDVLKGAAKILKAPEVKSILIETVNFPSKEYNYLKHMLANNGFINDYKCNVNEIYSRE